MKGGDWGLTDIMGAPGKHICAHTVAALKACYIVLLTWSCVATWICTLTRKALNHDILTLIAVWGAILIFLSTDMITRIFALCMSIVLYDAFTEWFSELCPSGFLCTFLSKWIQFEINIMCEIFVYFFSVYLFWYFSLLEFLLLWLTTIWKV